MFRKRGHERERARATQRLCIYVCIYIYTETHRLRQRAGREHEPESLRGSDREQTESMRVFVSASVATVTLFDGSGHFDRGQPCLLMIEVGRKVVGPVLPRSQALP